MRKFYVSIHPSWSFYTCVTGIIIGIIFTTSTQTTFFPDRSLIYLVLALALLLISIFKSSPATLPLALLAGFIFANYRTAPEITDQTRFISLVGQTITIEGQLSGDPSSDSSGTTIHLINLRLASPSQPSAEPISLRGTLYAKLSSQNVDLVRSDQITLTGKLGEGFGTFIATMFRPSIQSITKSPDLPIQLKHFFANLVREQIPSPASDLGLGYLVGEKSGLSEEFSNALRAVGMTHVVVASGAHLAILINLVKKVFGKLSKFAGLLFSLLAVLAFALVVGFTPSMTRASLVTTLGLLVGYVGRQFTPFRLILFVAAITLLITPNNFLNLGWQLSFASFFSILILAPRLTKFLYGGKKPPWLASMFITSLATSLICTPLLIYSFGSFSLLSFVANLIILPTLPYAMLFTFLSGTTSFLPLPASPISWLATNLLNFHIWLINLLSTQTSFIFELPEGNPYIFLLYLPIFACLLLPKLKKICYNKRHEHQTYRRNNHECQIRI